MDAPDRRNIDHARNQERRRVKATPRATIITSKSDIIHARGINLLIFFALDFSRSVFFRQMCSFPSNHSGLLSAYIVALLSDRVGSMALFTVDANGIPI